MLPDFVCSNCGTDNFFSCYSFTDDSCSPNLSTYLVLVESMDCQLAHVGLFAKRDVQTLLSFSLIFGKLMANINHSRKYQSRNIEVGLCLYPV